MFFGPTNGKRNQSFLVAANKLSPTVGISGNHKLQKVLIGFRHEVREFYLGERKSKTRQAGAKLCLGL